MGTSATVGTVNHPTMDFTDMVRTTCPACGEIVAPPCQCKCGLGIPLGTEADHIRHKTYGGRHNSYGYNTDNQNWNGIEDNATKVREES